MAGDIAQLGITLSMTDNATPQMRSFGTTLTSNKAAIRELAMGVTYLGSSFLGLGVALAQSNNPLAKSISQTAIMVGGIMSAVGASVQFISAIAKMVSALRALQIQQMITQAFAGPVGWISLGIGAAVAGGAIAGTAAYSRSQSQVSNRINIENKVMLDGKQIGSSVRKEIVLTQQRNNTSGIK